MQLWRRIFGAVSRFLYPDPALSVHTGAPMHLQEHPARATYSTDNAMAAYSTFPWVKAAVDAIATDLSGVPLVAERVGPGGERVPVRAHRVLDLLRHPHPECGGVAFRRQLYADFALTGNAYIRRFGELDQLGTVLVRLDPRDTKPLVDARTGRVNGYKWGVDEVIPPGEVYHVRDISVGKGVDASIGASPIHPLHDGLVASRHARKHASKMAKRGRIEVLLTPADPMSQFGDEGATAIKDRYLTASSRGDGVVVMNKHVAATTLTLTPHDLEFPDLDDRTRDETLAGMQVAPVRAQQPTANYGTARQQMRQLWENHRHKAALFDEVFSRLTGAAVYVRHDFTHVEALQTSRTERQMRASVWISAFGMTPKQAAEYEGFNDAPVPAATPADLKVPRRPAQEVEEPQAASLADAVTRYLHGAAVRYQALAALGDLPEHLEQVERGLAVSELSGAGIASAELWGAELAAVVDATVRLYVAEANGDAVIGVRSLRVFDPGHVDRLCRLITASEAAA